MSEYISTVLQCYKQMTDIRDVGAVLISIMLHVIQFCAFQFHVTTDITAVHIPPCTGNNAHTNIWYAATTHVVMEYS